MQFFRKRALDEMDDEDPNYEDDEATSAARAWNEKILASNAAGTTS